MDKTPLRNKNVQGLKSVMIPPSPEMIKLGYGTGVAVYRLNRATSSNTIQSPWALKRLNTKSLKNKELSTRLRAEADVLRKLTHPNIVGFRAVIKDTKGNVTLAMEVCSESLGDLIEQRSDKQLGAFRPDKILKVAKDMFNALNYLHNTAFILHCDIKSFNVLIQGDFKICKLCDFGVSMPLDKNGVLNVTAAGEETEFGGTLAWSPPEVLCLEQIISTKIDIYSLGLVFWEMLALSTPPLPDDDNDLTSDDDLSFEKENISETRIRPDLPDQDLGDEYHFVLELYYLCTMEDYNKRPSAEELTNIIN